MISRRLKSAFYVSLGLPMRANGWIWRTFRTPAPAAGSAAAADGTLKVQLGPGQRNYLGGWVNVDANLITAKIDLWADLRNRLPFRDATVDAFYSHHVIEHLPDALLHFHFREMFRCLKPGGSIRVGGPDGGNAAAKFARGDLSWFPDFPDKHESLGGKFTNFLICRGEHLTILTHSYLTELATAAGFTNVERCLPVRETRRPALFDEVLKLEYETDFQVPHTVLIEADKPRTTAAAAG
jgi:predicted SAM-dependent methyltransferase